MRGIARFRGTRGSGSRPRFVFVGATIVGILILQLVAVIAAGVSSRRDSVATTQDLFRYVGDATVERVLRFTEPAANLTREVVASIENGEMPGDPADIEDWLFERFRHRNGVSGLYIGFQDGAYVSVTRAGEGYEAKFIAVDPVRRVTVERYDERFHRISSTIDPTDTYDPRVRPWYVLAEATQGLSWTDPFFFFGSNEPGVSATLAIREEGSLMAVIGVEVKIDDLSNLLASLPLGENGEAFILTEKRTIVAAPPQYADRMIAAEGDSTLSIPASLLGLPDTWPAGLSARTPEVFGNDGERVTFESLFPDSSGIRWTLYIRASDREISPGLAGFQSTMLWLTLLISGLVLAATYFLYRLRFPIGVLSVHARTDELTQIANRRHYQSEGQAMVSSAREDGERVCVAVFDLDEFKRVNDTFGHDVGDEVLKAVAAALVGISRERDLVARLGGDEFAIVTRLSPGASAASAIERIRSHVEKALRSGENEWGPVGVTAGFTVSDTTDRGLAALTREADGALLEGKAGQKGVTIPGRRVASQGNGSSARDRR